MRLDNIPPWKQELLSRRSALARTLDPDLGTKPQKSFQNIWKDGATEQNKIVFKPPRPLLCKSESTQFKTITCEGTNGRALFSPLSASTGDPGRRCLSWPKDQQLYDQKGTYCANSTELFTAKYYLVLT